MGGRPLRIFTIIATNVPFSAYYFAMLAFVKMAVFLNASTRFVPYVVYRVLSTLMCKTDFEKNQLLKPPPAKIAQWVGWESFVFLVGAVYAPLAPYATGIAWVYLSLATSALKLNLATVSKMPFETAGKSWRLGISQSINIVMVAHCLQIGVLLFSGNFIHFVLTLPVVLVDVYYAQKCGHRYENKNIHGKAKGRLPLLEASDVDKSRPPSYIHEIDKVFEADAFYAPSCALNNDVLAPFQDQENLELREISLFDWLARYDSPSKLPPQSQHSSEKSAEESKKEKAIQMA
ncbi:hypothetical protein CTAYLR_007726 [Chrysophaeum taylorii]|nr:hypothetical protein CTAYLR_007726 [Chrysophaeum taylorii]